MLGVRQDVGKRAHNVSPTRGPAAAYCAAIEFVGLRTIFAEARGGTRE